MNEAADGMRLQHYLNARVTVQYGGQALGFSDTGTLTYRDDTWIEITRESGERLLIPIAAIRYLKLLEAPRFPGDAATLLRPAAGEP